MNHSLLVALGGLALGIAHSAIAADVPANISIVRMEAIPVQTLTISDEQFLKGDAYGQPTIIAGTLRIAKGPGRLPLVVFVAGSGGFNPNIDVWGKQFEEMGISHLRWTRLPGAASSARSLISRSLAA